jgi:hypothetical protein
MGADSPEGPEVPEDANEPPDRPAGPRDHRDEQGGGGRGGRGGGEQIEPRSRQEYDAELRVTVAAQESAAVQRSAAKEQAAAQRWDETATESRWMWGEHQRKWPPEDRPPVDRSEDPPGSWRGEGGRYLGPAVNDRVDAECGRVTECEQDKISPALRAAESQDPDRHLIGFEHRLKGPDRLKEKVYDGVQFLKRSPEEAVSHVHDAIRYTFQYKEARYTQGMQDDIGRLKDQGFELERLKNSWSCEQYKGINSQWIEPDTGQRFEVQFHTRISFEAKQLTHGAYERLRSGQADSFEDLVLEALQKKVTGEVPVPPGARSIPDYPERGADVR